MKFAVDLTQSFPRYVRVDLSGANARMPEQFLNHAQISAMFQKMGRKTVPEHVRRHISRKAALARPSFDSKP